MAEREHRGHAGRVVAAVADEQPFRVVDAAVAGDGVQDRAVAFTDGQGDGQPAARLRPAERPCPSGLKILRPPLPERDLSVTRTAAVSLLFVIPDDFLRYAHAIVRDHDSAPLKHARNPG
jgi:hypothetical protein